MTVKLWEAHSLFEAALSRSKRDLCGERAWRIVAPPALGGEAPLMKTNAVCQALLSAWFWGCCAAQRGRCDDSTSPLATKGWSTEMAMQGSRVQGGFLTL